MTRRRTTAFAVGLAVSALLVPAGVARADPAVPTDFSTRVVAIEPETPSIDVGFVGGDSFIELAVQPGTEVVVPGYWGEPYLRFNRDGTVERNARSPSVAQNESRYGGGSSASDAGSNDATWRTI